MTVDGPLLVNAWVAFGILGQALFASRFIVQWLVSERRKESTVPVAFWCLSLAGGAILFVYASWYRHDPVFTIGQSVGLVVYARNLMLIRRAPANAGGEVAPQRAGAAGA
ncbi:MAG: lipid-A-disaccharide synthase N-terminal domain-containing protein [Acidobacteria bacterium]|nr:lipid-A-disaccharide synthase N-terminal domain-containing protein [Acidobacteriota bacterium]